MWRASLILNALLMAIFGLGCALSQIQLRNLFVSYPPTGEKLFGGLEMLPAISLFALHHNWLYLAIPTLWALGTAVILVLCQKTGPEGIYMASLHTSATLLVGATMLLFFIAAGVMPFVPLVTGIEQ